MVEPGLVTLNRWPAADDQDPGEDIAAYCGIGRKPAREAERFPPGR
jgi:hypothetical protein